MAATYLMIPIASVAGFAGAANESWLALYRDSLPVAIAFAVVFIGLATLLFRQMELEISLIFVAFATFGVSGFIARWLGERTGASWNIIELVLIAVVMIALVVTALLLERRRLAPYEKAKE